MPWQIRVKEGHRNHTTEQISLKRFILGGEGGEESERPPPMGTREMKRVREKGRQRQAERDRERRL